MPIIGASCALNERGANQFHPAPNISMSTRLTLWSATGRICGRRRPTGEAPEVADFSATWRAGRRSSPCAGCRRPTVARAGQAATQVGRPRDLS